MKPVVKRSFSILLALILCLNLLSGLSLHADAADYIANWGTRGTTATFLSQEAKDFYADNGVTYEQLAALPGGTQSSAPSSALYAELQRIMVSSQHYITSYDATRDLFKYTDCQNGDYTSSGAISSFYSGKGIGPAWDSGSTWNREHTWPNSKGDASGQGENDIMMLRPTASSENSSRGNKAYGLSSGFYDPNSASGGKYNLHGDVARILLFVYVRWGNDERMWGSDGVIESLPILLDWIEEDPVDTWELGRNDSVESITGTRNVFVDYPELAFLLFSEDVPANMVTPSGSTLCSHPSVESVDRIPATCTSIGHEAGTRCTACGTYTQGGAIIPMLEHTYVNGYCSCGAAEPVMFERLSQLKTGDVVAIVAPAYGKALSTQKVATYYNKGVDVSESFDNITATELFVVTVNSDGSYTFETESGSRLALAEDYSSLNEQGVNDRWTLTVVPGSDGLFYVRNVARGNYLEWYNSKNNWSTYTPNSLDNQFEIAFYTRPAEPNPPAPPTPPDIPVNPPTGIPGDLNGDSSVDDLDVELLLWYYLFDGAFQVNGDVDFNKDGSVDDLDVEILLWHYLFGTPLA